MNTDLATIAADENTPPEQLKEIAKQNIELARIVAKNPSTEPKLLAKLAYDLDKEIRAAVTNNPNTPSDILWTLGAEFPEKLLSNPVLELLFLENPELLETIPRETAIALLKHEKAPEWLLVQAIKTKDKDFCYVVARNSGIPDRILEKLAKEGDALIRISIAKNPSTSIDLLKKLVQDPINFVSVAAAKQITKKLSKYQINFSEDGTIHIDEIIAATNMEMQRIGWTTEKGRKHLINTYGKRSRYTLTDEELLEFWQHLMSL